MEKILQNDPLGIKTIFNTNHKPSNPLIPENEIKGIKNPASLENIIDIKTLTNTYPQFNEQQLRWIISQRKFNGINDTNTVLFKVGKRWFIDIPLFIYWMKNKAA